jgi:hypothetical protein
MQNRMFIYFIMSSLLIMGFNKFKHLPKSECCRCIREHLLGHRSCEDIKKQLSLISNSEQRQNNLKELLKKQKQMNMTESFTFNRRIHYKSPFEQSDKVRLPSMYTVRFFDQYCIFKLE